MIVFTLYNFNLALRVPSLPNTQDVLEAKYLELESTLATANDNLLTTSGCMSSNVAWVSICELF